jgi:hypothetical protein
MEAQSSTTTTKQRKETSRMKAAVINNHHNRTLAMIVRDLAIKAGYRPSRNLTERPWEFAAMIFRAEGDLTGNFEIKTTSGVLEGTPYLDAATQMDKVIAFFEQPADKLLELSNGKKVSVNADGSISWHCGTVIPAADVTRIIEVRTQLLKEVA